MRIYDYQCHHCQTVLKVCTPLKEKGAGLLLYAGGGVVEDQMPGSGPNVGKGCCGR